MWPFKNKKPKIPPIELHFNGESYCVRAYGKYLLSTATSSKQDAEDFFNSVVYMSKNRTATTVIKSNE